MDSMRRFKAGVFQALAHPTRVGIVELLMQGEMSVGQLCDRLGVEQANASQHLSILRSKYLVETRKVNNQIFYRLRDPLLGQVLNKLRDYYVAHMEDAIETLKHEQLPQGKRRSEVKR